VNDSQKVQYLIEILRTGTGGADAANDFKKADDASKRLNDSLSNLKKVVGATVLAIGGFAVLRDWVREAGAAEQANARLVGSLRATGQYSKEYAGELQKMAGALQDATTATDESVTAIASQLVSFGAARKQIPQLTEAILDFAAANGNAEGATTAFGAAIAGNVAPLARILKTQFDEGASSAEAVARGLELIQSRWGGMAREMTNTDIGRIKQTENAISDLKEEMGRAVLQAVRPFVLAIRDGSRQLNEFAGSATYTRTVVADGMVAMAGSIGAVTLAMGALRANAGANLLFGGAAIRSVRDLTAAIMLLGTASASTFAVMSAGVFGLTAGVWTVVEAVKALNAEMQKEKAQQGLGAMNAKFRQAVEGDIDKQVSEGKLSAEQAAGLKAKISRDQFNKKETFRRPSMGVGDPGSTTTRTVLDSAAEHAALRGAFNQLHPELKTTSPAEKQATAEQKQALKDLAKLYEEMEIAALDGIAKEEAAAMAAFKMRTTEIEAYARKAMITEDERIKFTSKNEEVACNEIAAIHAKDDETSKTVARELWNLENELRVATLEGFVKERAQAEVTFEQRKRQILALKDITDEQRASLLALLNQSAQLDQAAITAKQLGDMGPSSADFYAHKQQKADRFGAMKSDVDDERTQLLAGDDAKYEQQVERRKETVADFYNFQIEQAREAGRATEQIEQDKSAHLQALAKTDTAFKLKLYQGVAQVESKMVEGLASGMTDAIMAMADKTKSAQQAWEDFGRAFLRMIAQMILQLTIQLALEAAIAAIKASFFAGGGMAVSGGVDTPSSTSTNARMAADGVAGVGEVSSPTLFKKFNTIAGEAGRELFTVLARPRAWEHDGMRGVEGMAQGRRLMIMPAEQFEARLNRAASGYVSGGTSSFGGSGSAGAHVADGHLVIEVRHSEAAEARIVSSSVQRAKVEVIRDVGRDTPLRKAVGSVGR